MSFQWQVSLLGTLVVILFFAVLFAIVATLRYTKSAVVSAETKRLTEAANNLAQEYEDRADSARLNKQPPPLDNPNTATAQEVMALVSRIVLQNHEGVGGGFYSTTADMLVGNFYPAGEARFRERRINPWQIRSTKPYCKSREARRTPGNDRTG